MIFFSGSQTDPCFQNKNNGCKLTGQIFDNLRFFNILEYKPQNSVPQDEALRRFRTEGSVLQNNGLSVKIFPRFKSFMVDHFGSQHSDSAVFWHNDKDADVLRNYWIVQKDNTVFPKCEVINS